MGLIIDKAMDRKEYVKKRSKLNSEIEKCYEKINDNRVKCNALEQEYINSNMVMPIGTITTGEKGQLSMVCVDFRVDASNNILYILQSNRGDKTTGYVYREARRTLVETGKDYEIYDIHMVIDENDLRTIYDFTEYEKAFGKKQTKWDGPEAFAAFDYSVMFQL